MNTIDASVMDRLKRMSVDLSAVFVAVSGKTPVFSAEAQEKVSRRICLLCEKTISPRKRYVRGLCGPDGQMVTKAIRAGEATEFELIEMGCLAPEAPSGRKPSVKTKLHELLEARRRGLRVDPSNSGGKDEAAKHSMAEIEKAAGETIVQQSEKSNETNNRPPNHS